jgi:glutathione reductase (NADPH)
MTAYDAVVIGSGTAGQTAAYSLKAGGLSVAVVEKSDRPGGTCALAGCQAKKWFYEGMEVIAKSQHLEGKGILSIPNTDWRRSPDHRCSHPFGQRCGHHQHHSPGYVEPHPS